MKKVSVAIIGAGPAGIAAGVECKALSIPNIIIFEKGTNFCSTIRRLYPPGKRVDRDYKGIIATCEGICSFDTETKEDFLKRMGNYIDKYFLSIDYEIEINGIEKRDDSYILKAGTFQVVEAYVVVIATGVFDRPKRPSYPIPEAVKDKVFFELPKEIPQEEKILIVGGGNTAAELACLLAGKCEVYLSYRRPQFFRINEENLKELEKRKDSIKFFLGTEIKALEAYKESVKVIFHDGHKEVFSKIFYCLGGSTPKNFLQKMGIEILDNKPAIDEFGESNLERIFLIGDIATKKGSIMHAFNSAHRAVKRIIDKYPNVKTL